MKTIILVRHATAEDHKDGLSDISRSLLKDGRKYAGEAAKFMKKRISAEIDSSMLISSPANRALETAHIFAERLNYPTTRILIKENVYSDPSPDSFLGMVREISDACSTAIIFGHNPSISEWASFLVKGFEFDVPKAGIVAIEVQKESWRNMEKEIGQIKYIEYPEDAPKKSEKLMNDLQSRLSAHITEWLSTINQETSSLSSRSVEKYSHKIIKDFLKELNGKNG